MDKMTLKVMVNDLHFRNQLWVSQDPCLLQIWWFQLKFVMSYRTDKVKFTDRRTDRRTDRWTDGQTQATTIPPGFLLGWNFFRTICPGCQRSTGHLQFLQDNFSWTINWNLKVRLIVVRKHSTLMAKSGNVLHRQFIVNTTNVMSRGFDHQLPLLLIWINFNPIVDK